jgi:hypothetical protein
MLDGMCGSLLDVPVAGVTIQSEDFMFHQRSSTCAGILGLALLHCGTPGSADDATALALPGTGDDSPNEPAQPVPTEIVNAGDTREVDDTPPEVGGQTGDDSGVIALECDVVTQRELGLNELSFLGFSANEMLALVLGTHTLSMRWFSPEGSVDGPPSEVTVGVELVGDTVRQLDRFDSKYGVDCTSLLEADAHLTLTSADGALAEEGEGTLDLGGVAGLVNASFTIPAPLGGTYTFDPPNFNGQEPSGLGARMTFSRYGQSGALGTIYGTGRDAVSFRLSEWPVWQQCGFWGWIPAVYEEQRPSTADLLEMLRSAASITLID